MPRLSGVAFVQEVRKTDATTQIIILSAHTNTEDFLADGYVPGINSQII